jgi:hypothetical protein
LPISPLIIFEYFHKFEEIKRLISYAGGKASETRNLDKLIYLIKANNPYFSFTFRSLIEKDEYVHSIILIIIILFLIIRSKSWKNVFHKVMLPLTFIISLVYYFLLPSHSPEYYFIGTETILFIYFYYGLSKLKVRYILLVTFLVLIYNFHLLQLRWNRDNLTTIYHKDQAVKRILSMQPKDEDFFVSYISKPGWKWGFDYFFKLYDRLPQTKEVKDPIYTIVVPKELVSDDYDYESGNIRLILPER